MELLLSFFEAEVGGGNGARQREYEEAVARCMAEKGFEYVPDVPASVDETVDAAPGLSYYETWGYGISIDASEAYGDDALQADDGDSDPNAAYVASLSPAGRQAYMTALEGDPPEADPASGTESQNLGCYVAASEDVAGSAPAQAVPALVESLEEEVSALESSRIASDARVRAAAADQVDCVVAAGGEPYDPFAGESAYQQVADAYAAATEDGPLDAAALAAFQTWERAIATAESRCGEAVSEAVAQVHREVVVEVVGPYAEELRSLVEDAGS